MSAETEYNIVTNYQHREVLAWHDLTDAEREQLDYVTKRESTDDWSGFRYRGSVYDLSEFMVAPDGIKRHGFDGVQAQSYFDCVAVRWFDHEGHYHGYETVVVAHVHW